MTFLFILFAIYMWGLFLTFSVTYWRQMRRSGLGAERHSAASLWLALRVFVRALIWPRTLYLAVRK